MVSQLSGVVKKNQTAPPRMEGERMGLYENGVMMASSGEGKE